MFKGTHQIAETEECPPGLTSDCFLSYKRWWHRNLSWQELIVSFLGYMSEFGFLKYKEFQEKIEKLVYVVDENKV